MKVPDGYEVRCFASEPMIINPVAMTWDHRGRLWVVELYEYPKGAKNPNEYSKIATDEKFRPVVKADANSPRDKVIVLEDTDNDGKADKRTVFAEGLNLATGILCGYGGVFVGQAPNLFFFRDNDGNDKADEYKTVLTGFGLEDRHELLNSFTWGPDGWLYMTHGVFTHSKVRRPEQKPEEGFKLDAGIFRVKISGGGLQPPSVQQKNDDQAKSSRSADGGSNPPPHAAAYEVYADGTSNPWGVDFDARGNAFVSACVIDHLFHMAPGGLYQRQGGAPENPYAYELLPSIVSHKHFRAAYAGIQIYQGGIYPADTHGHLFIGNIHDNAIHEESLTPAGATFKAAPVRDFLRANDGWFRPVSTQTGPDGFLWIMDWCDKYPCYQNAQANPEGVDRERGRIWRICYVGSDEGKRLANASRPSAGIDRNKLDARELIYAAIDAPNSWSRRIAVQRLREHPSREALEIVEAFMENGILYPLGKSTEPQRPEGNTSPESRRLCAAWAWASLINVRRDDANFWETALSKTPKLAAEESPALRAWTARIIGNDSDLGLAASTSEEPPQQRSMGWSDLMRLARDKDPTVRHAVAIAARQVEDRHLTLDRFDGDASGRRKSESVFDSPLNILDPLIRYSAKDADKTLAFAVWQSLEAVLADSVQRTLTGLTDTLLESKPLSLVLTYKTARRITDTRKPENMDLLLAFLDKIKDDDVLIAHALDGMLKAQEAGAVKPAKTDPAPFFARWAASKSPDVRNHAGRLATLWGDKAAVTALIKLAEDPNTDAARRAEAIRTLRKLNSDEARAALLRILEKAVPQ